MTKQEKVKPTEIFEDIKGNLGIIDKIKLKKYIAVSNKLLTKAEITGQTDLKQRLEFRIRTLARELEMLKTHNIDTYIEKQHITTYIEQTELREVKITDLSSYLREIPDEAIDIIADTREIFDDFFILFTDYTGEMAQKAEDVEVERDPILFGVFYDNEANEFMDRFYFLYDWEDEYCDLTLDKLIMEYQEISDEEIAKVTTTNIKKATQELKEEESK